MRTFFLLVVCLLFGKVHAQDERLVMNDLYSVFMTNRLERVFGDLKSFGYLSKSSPNLAIFPRAGTWYTTETDSWQVVFRLPSHTDSDNQDTLIAHSGLVAFLSKNGRDFNSNKLMIEWAMNLKTQLPLVTVTKCSKTTPDGHWQVSESGGDKFFELAEQHLDMLEEAMKPH